MKPVLTLHPGHEAWATGAILGGYVYGSAEDPVDPGSSGGSYSAAHVGGGGR